MSYWETIKMSDERKLMKKFNFEWMMFYPEPLFKLLNPYDMRNLGLRPRRKVLEKFIISEGWCPAQFSFRRGSSEGYVVDIQVYSENDTHMGKLTFKFLDRESPRKMIYALMNPNYIKG